MEGDLAASDFLMVRLTVGMRSRLRIRGRTRITEGLVVPQNRGEHPENWSPMVGVLTEALGYQTTMDWTTILEW